MMKIHKTQNLGTLSQNQNLSTDIKDIRLNYSNYSKHSAQYYDNVMFKQKDKLPKIAKRIKDTTSKRASDKKNLKERIISSDRFNRMLLFIGENEVLSQAGIAFLVGWIFRVPTIMALPVWLGGKHKEDKAYAAAHSGSSVSMGVFTAAGLTLPVNKGTEYARKKLLKKLDPEILKKRYPQLDLKSIKDEAGNILDKEFWKNIDGKVFSENVRTPMTVARPIYLGDIAESTYKSLGIDIDMAANAGKDVQDIVLRDGRKLTDVLSTKDMYIAIEEEGIGTTLKGLKDTNFFCLDYVDKDYLHSAMPELNIETAFVDGKITHPKNWKTTDGKPAFNFDVYLSSYLETSESTLAYTGIKRIEGEGTDKAVEKLAGYQDNGDGSLGTLITNEMIKADKDISTTNKTIGWMVDIFTRVPVGLCTVALIPQILKLFDAFKIDKKNANRNEETKEIPQEKSSQEIKGEEKVAEVNFKGKGDSKKTSKFIEFLGKNYAFRLLNSKKLANFIENFNKKIDMSMTEVMTILGSFLTSSAYIYGTITNDKLDKNRRNTLAINQFLSFLIPTFLSAYVSRKVSPHVKKFTYDFVGNQTQKVKLKVQQGTMNKEEEVKALKSIATARNAIPVLASLTVFTFIYRYFTPVAVTPVANWIGNKILEKKNKAQEEKSTQAA